VLDAGMKVVTRKEVEATDDSVLDAFCSTVWVWKYGMLLTSVMGEKNFFRC
jgi:hypothetical protein